MALTFLQIATMALVIALIVTALFSSVIAFWVQTHYQRYTTPTRAVLIYNLEPVFSALFAVWLLRENLSGNVLLGGGLILLGMCLPGLIATLTGRHRQEQETPSAL